MTRPWTTAAGTTVDLDTLPGLAGELVVAYDALIAAINLGNELSRAVADRDACIADQHRLINALNNQITELRHAAYQRQLEVLWGEE